jgi:ABC-2 type transport system ATP-binding protein
MTPPPPSISVKADSLSHRYDTYLAVDHVSFEIASNTTFGLIGPNGAGKSTTIKMLTTLLPISSGNAWINGYHVNNQPAAVRHSIGYVPQLISADGELSAYENLLLSAKLYELPKKEREQRIDAALAFMQLTSVKDKLVKTFSGGMIRRLEIAQSLLHDPTVLFLDEPTVGLDPAARKAMWRHIDELKRSKKTTIFMTTHDMDEADALCDQVALMHLGKIIVMDTPAKLKASIGATATLDDVFIVHTGSSIKETEDFQNVKQMRRTISNL